jgi:hypothetical protein
MVGVNIILAPQQYTCFSAMYLLLDNIKAPRKIVQPDPVSQGKVKHGNAFNANRSGRFGIFRGAHNIDYLTT